MVNNYFPELNKRNYKSKYGILDVGLIKNEKVVSGYQWQYIYYVDGKTKFIKSYDLRVVREKVLKMGGEWIITDSKEAIKSYKFNNELVKIHDDYFKKYGKKYWGSSGVKYVSKQKDYKGLNKTYWTYKKDKINYCDEYLSELKKKVIQSGENWIVKDEKLYKENLLNNNKAI